MLHQSHNLHKISSLTHLNISSSCQSNAVYYTNIISNLIISYSCFTITSWLKLCIIIKLHLCFIITSHSNKFSITSTNATQVTINKTHDTLHIWSSCSYMANQACIQITNRPHTPNHTIKPWHLISLQTWNHLKINSLKQKHTRSYTLLLLLANPNPLLPLIWPHINQNKFSDSQIHFVLLTT